MDSGDLKESTLGWPVVTYNYDDDNYWDSDWYDPYYDDVWYYDEADDWSYNDLWGGLPTYSPTEDLGDDWGVFAIFEYFRYVMNVWLIAIPWMPCIGLLWGYNVWFNI
jgi:hypothetical protein